MADQKVYMLNAFWFKPDGGFERYKDYMSDVLPMIEEAGGQKLKSLIPTRSLVGEFDADLMYFVEFPSWAAYRSFANSASYHKVAYKLRDAVDKSMLIRCDRPEK